MYTRGWREITRLERGMGSRNRHEGLGEALMMENWGDGSWELGVHRPTDDVTRRGGSWWANIKSNHNMKYQHHLWINHRMVMKQVWQGKALQVRGSKDSQPLAKPQRDLAGTLLLRGRNGWPTRWTLGIGVLNGHSLMGQDSRVQSTYAT